MANIYFAVYPVRNLPMASGALADGKFLVCHRQIKSLPIANDMHRKSDTEKDRSALRQVHYM